MKTYTALLRGINVGGHHKIKMADLKDLFLTLRFRSVITYIQSGNVVFRDASEDMDALTLKIRTGIKKRFGFDIPVLLITNDTLRRILIDNPFAKRIENGEVEVKKMYFMLLYESPDKVATAKLSAISFTPEEFSITKDVIYLFAANGYGKTKLHTNFFEKKLKCQATTRNFKTMNKLLEINSLLK